MPELWKEGRRMTNYEKIKAMSVEEMAVFMTTASDCKNCAYNKKCKVDGTFNCHIGTIEWLESEAEENG